MLKVTITKRMDYNTQVIIKKRMSIGGELKAEKALKIRDSEHFKGKCK